MVERDTKMFLGSIAVAFVIAWLLSMIEIWHLILIAGVVAGLLNKTMKRGILSGAAGVGALWAIYSIYKMVSIGSYTVMDQFGALLISGGFGWLILTLILLFGVLFGALGGGIGSGVMMLVKGTDPSSADES